MAALNRFYWPTKYKSRAEVLSLGIKCVFIAHQQRDKIAAKKIADYLIGAGVDVYFDEYDTELRGHHQSKNPKEVTNSILKGINNSSDMLVIVSPNTMTSTWVPFEIGFGYDKTSLSALCLKGIPKGKLPEYLRTVPIIRDVYDFNNRIVSFTGTTSEQLMKGGVVRDHSYSYHPLNDVMDSFNLDTYENG